MKFNHHLSIAAALLAAAGASWGQSFSLEGAVIDSRTAQSLGVISERGDINSLFRAQKTMTFGILRAAGISLDQLSPEVRARVERFQTTNLDAFRAYSQGLELKDQGKFIEARAQFRRAAELDPSFSLATEQQQAMPEVNLGAAVVTRAVLNAAAGAAVDRGKASVVVDTARAVAAMAAGATVVLINAPLNTDPIKVVDSYSVNNTGQGGDSGASLVAGYSYSQRLDSGNVVGVASAQGWGGRSYRVNNGVLESLGTSTDFLAVRLNALNLPGGSTLLSDNATTAYWGAWADSPSVVSSASVSAGGKVINGAALGQLDYIFGTATLQMPGTGTATYTPFAGAGLLGVTEGTIQVNFGNRIVNVQNLSLTTPGGLVFSGLNGQASYGQAAGPGTFGANYTSGSCAGCTAFSATASSFNGSFLGRNANGLVYSSILVTGNPGNTTSSGLQLFTRPGP